MRSCVGSTPTLFRHFFKLMSDNQTLRTIRDGYVATVELRRPPHNFLDVAMMAELADLLCELGADSQCRAIVLAAQGKHFSAGADFKGVDDVEGKLDPSVFYYHAMRIFDVGRPIFAAVQGSAIGAGAGLALSADFRVVSKESRFSFPFTRLGFHPGFGLTHTLPKLVGAQRASRIFYTGASVQGPEAVQMGLADVLTIDTEVIVCAQALAREIANSAPLAVSSSREALRAALSHDVRNANAVELKHQLLQFLTVDFREGVKAAADRRLPVFKGH